MTIDPEHTNQHTFDDNTLMGQLFGQDNAHLKWIEKHSGIQIYTRGNRVSLQGNDEDALQKVGEVLEMLYSRLQQEQDINQMDVEAAFGMVNHPAGVAVSAPQVEHDPNDVVIRTRRKVVHPRTAMQKSYIEALRDFEVVFGIGPAGTGKTYLAVAKAVECLMSGEVDRIILSRPAVEAGEHLGFLPGDLKEKVDPYLRPLYDALNDLLPPDLAARKLELGVIEIAPLAFMRGRTLSNAFVILDEAQNTTPVQMKMFLTRLGEGARMAINGDLSQIDLPKGTPSGLIDAADVLNKVKGVSFTRFTDADVIRHPLVKRMIQAYQKKG